MSGFVSNNFGPSFLPGGSFPTFGGFPQTGGMPAFSGPTDTSAFSMAAYLPDGSMLTQYLVSQGVVHPDEAGGATAQYSNVQGAMTECCCCGENGQPQFTMPGQQNMQNFGLNVDPAQSQQLMQALQQRGLQNNPSALAIALMLMNMGLPVEQVMQMIDQLMAQQPDLGALPTEGGNQAGGDQGGGTVDNGGGGGTVDNGGGGGTVDNGGGTGGVDDPGATTDPTATPASTKPTTNNLSQLEQDRLTKQNSVSDKNKQIADLWSQANKQKSDVVGQSTKIDPALKSQYEQSRLKGDQAKNDYDTAQKDIVKLRGDISTQVQNISKAASQCTSLETQLAAAEAKCGEKDDKGNATDAAQAARNQADGIRTQLRAAQDAKKKAETAKADLEKKLTEREQASDKSQQAMVDVQKQMDDLQTKMEAQDPDLTKKIDEANAEMEKKIQALDTEIQALSTEVADIEARMAEVQADVTAGKIDENGAERPKLATQPGEVENAADATRVLAENFDALDDPSSASLASDKTDGIIGKGDLEAVASGDPAVIDRLEKRLRAQAAQDGVPSDKIDAEVERRLAESRDAARYLTDSANKDELDNLDVGGSQGIFEGHDGKISREDVKNVHATAVEDQERKAKYEGKVDNVDQATKVLQDNFDVLDDPKNRSLTSGNTDGIIGKGDLEAVASGDPQVIDNVKARLRQQAAQDGIPTSEVDAYVEKRLSDVQAASAYLTDPANKGELDNLDIGGSLGVFEGYDGKISRNDLKDVREQIAKDSSDKQYWDRTRTAATTFRDNADVMDDVFNPSLASEHTDGKFGMNDIQAVADGNPEVLDNVDRRLRAQAAQNGVPSDQIDQYVADRMTQIRDAATFIASDEGKNAREMLDSGMGQNPGFWTVEDGKFSKKDFDAVLAADFDAAKWYMN